MSSKSLHLIVCYGLHNRYYVIQNVENDHEKITLL